MRWIPPGVWLAVMAGDGAVLQFGVLCLVVIACAVFLALAVAESAARAIDRAVHEAINAELEALIGRERERGDD